MMLSTVFYGTSSGFIVDVFSDMYSFKFIKWDMA